MPLRQDDELDLSTPQGGPVQGSRAGATVQLGADYFSYARERLSAIKFKEELVDRLLPTVPRRGQPHAIKRGEVFGKFEILERLGKGGMASVYRALDPERAQTAGSGSLEDRQSVALKVMKPEIAHNPEYVRRFLREAANTALIDHPNVVEMFEVGSVAGRLYFTMELIEGVTLKEHMKANPLSEAQGVQILGQFVDGLVAAHERGIGHRDLKPSNVMLVTADHRYGFGIKGDFDVCVKITDFGLAHMVATDQSEVMQEGRFLGTAKYVAPEVVKGEQANLKSDVFSLGIMAFSMFAGRSPFNARNKVEYIAANLAATAPLLDTRADVSHELALLVDLMLTKDPAKRPEGQAVRRDLTRLSQRRRIGDPIRVLDDPESTFYVNREQQGAPPPDLRLPYLLGGAALVLVLLGLGALLALREDDPPNDPPDVPPIVRPVDPPDRPPPDRPPPDDPPDDPPIVDPVDDPPDTATGPLLAAISPSEARFRDQLARLEFGKSIQRGDAAWKREHWRDALSAWEIAASLVSATPPALERRLMAAHQKVAHVEGRAAEDAGDFSRAVLLYKTALQAGVEDAELEDGLERAKVRVEQLRAFSRRMRKLRFLAQTPSKRDEALTLARELLAEAEPLGKTAEVQAVLDEVTSGSGTAVGEEALERAADLIGQRRYDAAESALKDASAKWGSSRRLRVLEQRLERGRQAPEGLVIFELPTSSLGDLPQALYASPTPISNAAYYAWFEVASKKETLIPPRAWNGERTPPPETSTETARGVQGSHAKKYARAKQARLPTAADYDLLEAVLGHPAERPKGRNFPEGFRIVKDVP